MTRLLLSLILITCCGCIPVYVNLGNNPDPKTDRYTPRTIETSSNELSRTNLFVCPLVVDELRFDTLASPLFIEPANIRSDFHPANGNETYDGMLRDHPGYIINCKCVQDVEIIDDKLVLIHRHSGTGGNRELTKLLWNGKYYKNSKGEFIADVLIDYPPSMYRVLIIEPKAFDVKPLRVGEQGYMWIHVVGFDHLIKYVY